MNENPSAPDWKLWLHCVLFSTLGYGIGGSVGWYAALIMGLLLYILPGFIGLPLYKPLVMVIAMVLGGTIAGAVVGRLQWEAVRLETPHVNKKSWMTVNIVGMAISWAIVFGILGILMKILGVWMEKPSDHMTLRVLVAGGLWGVLSAAILWRTLHGQIKHAAIWSTINSLCGIVVFVVGWIWIWIPYEVTGHRDEFSPLAPLVPSILSIISWPVAGFLYGLITASVLTWLLREPNQPVGSDEHVLAG